MTDKLFTKRLRDLTDEAIRESLAEISVEFERRFGPAALTASPPVVEREARPSHLSVIPVRGHPEKHAVFDAIMGDAIAVCPDEIAAQRVFDALTKADATPVAQGDDVRDALESALRALDPESTPIIRRLARIQMRHALTTLTKGARDAG